jgi:CMP-N,N'-diacetyllegionaminic acid synthase
METSQGNKNILTIIPARGKSKRIPKKNLSSLGGKPLIRYTIDAALGVKFKNQVLVTTDDFEIAEFAKSSGVHVQYPRPEELSGDASSSVDVLKYVVQTFETSGAQPEIILLLQPTSPFRTSHHIEEAVDLLLSTNADTVTAVRKVVEHPFYLWKPEGKHIVPLYSSKAQSIGRNELPPFYIENGSIYATTHDSLFISGLYGKKVVPYEMSLLESADIDEPIDLVWAEFLISQRLVSA